MSLTATTLPYQRETCRRRCWPGAPSRPVARRPLRRASAVGHAHAGDAPIARIVRPKETTMPTIGHTRHRPSRAGSGEDLRAVGEGPEEHLVGAGQHVRRAEQGDAPHYATAPDVCDQPDDERRDDEHGDDGRRRVGPTRGVVTRWPRRCRRAAARSAGPGAARAGGSATPVASPWPGRAPSSRAPEEQQQLRHEHHQQQPGDQASGRATA